MDDRVDFVSVISSYLRWTSADCYVVDARDSLINNNYLDTILILDVTLINANKAIVMYVITEREWIKCAVFI